MVARTADRSHGPDWRILGPILLAHLALLLWLLITRVILPLAADDALHVSFGEFAGDAAARGDRSLSVAPPRPTAAHNAAPLAIASPPRPEGRLAAADTAAAASTTSAEGGAAGHGEGAGSDASGGGRIHHLFHPPRTRDRPLPQYPWQAYAEHKQGTVLVMARVSAQGTVLSTRTYESSGSESLDTAAVDAVARWTFKPAERDDQPIDADVIVPVEWKIGRDLFIAPKTIREENVWTKMDPNHCDDNWMQILSAQNNQNHVSPPNCLHLPPKPRR